MKTFAIATLAGLAAASAATAQSGTLDQSSPFGNASFNLDANFLIWQQQVRAGIPGQLEGVSLTLQGPTGAQLDLRLRVGAAWSTTAPSFSATVTKSTSVAEAIFIPMTSANIQLAAGDVFVLETQGNGTGANIIGSYVAPPGTPLYAEPLFLTGSNFADGGWRHGFQTYMLGGAPACYANCDASTQAPLLNVLDFTCFLQKFAAGCP